MGKSNSKLKPEVVEELTRKTYCECAPRPPAPRPRAPPPRLGLSTQTPCFRRGPAPHPFERRNPPWVIPCPASALGPSGRPGLRPQPHTWPYCSRHPAPPPPRLGSVPTVSVRGATPRPGGEAPTQPRSPLRRAVRKGSRVPGPGAVVWAGGSWLRGGAGCAEPTGRSAAGRVIHASRCRCCEVGLSPPPWPGSCVGGGGWRDLSESSWQQRRRQRVLGALLAGEFTG